MHAAKPAEEQAGQQTAAATADRDRYSADPELDHADQYANQYADTEEDEVGDGRSADLVADLRLHPVEIGRAAGEVQFVAALEQRLKCGASMESESSNEQFAIVGRKAGRGGDREPSQRRKRS